jgi:hypothetical protein
VFIDKCILPLLPVWERDHTVDLSAVVDNPKLFEFVGNIRKSGAWTHSFENAQDIIETLRVQLAYQMNDGLRLIHTLSQNPELNYLNGISGKAFRIALEQQDFWEYRLFGQVLTDEIEKQADIRFQYKNELRLGQRERIAFDETYPWLMACLDELRSFADAINKLMNETLQEALGPPGISGDARAILLNAQHIVSVYTHAIQWSQRISKAYVDPIFREVVGIAATLADDIIVQIESMAPRLIQELDAALLEPDCVGPRVINIIIKLDLPNADKLSDAMDKVEQELGL